MKKNYPNLFKKVFIICMVYFMCITLWAQSPENALDFTYNDNVSIEDANSLDMTSNHTIEAWIKVTQFQYLGGIVSKYQTPGDAGYMLRLSSNSPYKGLSFDEMETANNILTEGQWYHVAAVNDNGTRRLYLNGIEQTLTGTPRTVSANTSKLRIGCDYYNDDNGSHYFVGNIDEVRIWNVVRTPADINYYKNRHLNGSEAGLMAYYNFNQGIAGGDNTGLTNLPDLTAYHNDGTLNRFYLQGPTTNYVASGVHFLSGYQEVITKEASDFTKNSVKVHAEITDTGRGNATERGICYGLSPSVTHDDNVVSETGSFGTGAYVLELSGLTSGSTYYARAYTINTEGISYGDTVRIVIPAFDNDLEITDIIPGNSPYSATEPVSVVIKNLGANSQSGFPVSFTFKGSTFTGTYAGTLACKESATFTFAQTIDLSVPGTYSISAATALPGDENTANDNMSKQFTVAGEVIIGSGTSTGQSLPIEPYYGYSYSQSIYLKSEMGISSGYINKIAFYYAPVAGYEGLTSSNQWKIYLANTTKSSFTSATNWMSISEFTPVYEGTFASPASAGWIYFDVTPFYYNGTGNLAIAVEDNQSGYDDSNDEFQCYQVTGSKRSIHYGDDSNNPNPASPPTARATSQYNPNIKFSYLLPQTITFTPFTTPVTYGDNAFTVSATGGASNNPVTFTSSNTNVATCSGTNGEIVTIVGAGTCTINANQAGGGIYYQAVQVPMSLTVNPKVLTVKNASVQNKEYDGTTGAEINGASPDGVIGTDDVTLTNATSGTFDNTDIGTGKAVTTTMGLSGAKSGNYSLIQPTLTGEIKAKTITVTATANQSKVYGEVDPVIQYTFAPQLVTGDVFTGSLVRAAGENAGAYPIEQGTLSAGAHYNITFNSSDFTITPRPVTVKAAANQKKVYGDADPALTYTYSPQLLSGDVFTGNLERAAGENTGIYAINQGTLSAGNNYSITYEDRDFVISAKPVTITVNEGQYKTYGDPDPAITYTINPQLVNGDFFTGNLGRVAGENVETYTIGQGTLNAGSNYIITVVSSQFTIKPKPIALSVSANQSKIYGAIDPVLTCGVSPALVEGDSFTGALVRTAGENAGTYAINQGTLSAGNNYTATFTGNTFTIMPKALNVTGASVEPKVYDGTASATIAGATLSGIVGMDDVTLSDATTGTFSNVHAGEGILVTTAPMVITGASVSNYTLNQPVLIGNITRAALTIGITAQNKVYDGNAVASVQASITSGLIAGDMVTANASNSTFDDKNAGTGKTVNADISLSGIDAGNYTCNVTATTFANITKAYLIADIEASLNSIYCKGGTTIDFTITYPAPIEVTAGNPYLHINGSARDSIILSSSDNITWICQWTSSDTIEGIVNLSVSLTDAAGNYKQSSTGTTLLILQHTPNGISEVVSNDILVYPTVNQGWFSIALNNPVNGKVNVRIVNAWGVMIKECQFVKTGSSAIFEVNMDKAPAGEYLVEVRMKGIRELRRVIKE